MKKYLFILRSAPHNGCHAQEMLDIILTTAAFDQHVSLLLLDEAVFQLKKNQQATKQNYKDTAAIFKALEIYDVKDIYVERESLHAYGLSSADLLLPVTELSRKKVIALMKSYDLVFSG